MTEKTRESAHEKRQETEWKRRVFIRDPDSGDGGGAVEFHDVDNGKRVQLTVCLQRGTTGDFSFCRSAEGYA